MDRFLMHVMIGYGDEAAETEIIRLVRGENVEASVRKSDNEKTQPDAISQDEIFNARAEIAKVHSSEAIENYIVDLIFATRYPGRYSEEIASWIEVGASPRGGIGLDKCSRAHAWLRGRDYVTPDDVRAVVHNVLRHRLILSYEANADGVTSDRAIKEIVTNVAVP